MVSYVTLHEKSNLASAASEYIDNGGVVLDIGCGPNPQTIMRCDALVCIEPHLPYCAMARAKRPDALILWGDWNLPAQASTGRFAAVTLLDVIEHMTRAEGWLCVCHWAERANQVIVWTPWGEYPQAVDHYGTGGEYWQTHRSAWTPSDFAGNGWRVFACQEYHEVDQHGNRLAEPIGAFWAVWKRKAQ